MRSIPPPRTPRLHRVRLAARVAAMLALAFLLAGVIAPRLVNAHDTLQLVLALALYALAAAAVGWGGYMVFAGLRRRRPYLIKDDT